MGEAVASYLGLLAGLVMASPATNTSGTTQAAATGGGAAAAAAATPDDALAAAEDGAAASATGASWLAAPTSRLRHAVQWEWGEAALAPPAGAQPRSSGASDALYELASVLVSAAIRLMHAAAQASTDSPSGVPTPASTRSYRLLREAAGMLELVARDVLPLLPGGISADCDPQVGRLLAGDSIGEEGRKTMGWQGISRIVGLGLGWLDQGARSKGGQAGCMARVMDATWLHSFPHLGSICWPFPHAPTHACCPPAQCKRAGGERPSQRGAGGCTAADGAASHPERQPARADRGACCGHGSAVWANLQPGVDSGA